MAVAAEKTAPAVADDKLVSFDDVDKANDLKYDTVEVAEWGGKIRLVSINAEDMIEFVESNDGPAKRTAGLRLIIKSAVDAEGNRIFKDEHLQVLKKRNSATCNRIVNAILQLNGLNVKDQATAKND